MPDDDQRQTDQRAEDQHDKEVVKEAIKEAITEWLTSRYQDFGRWSLFGLMSLIAAFALSVFIYFVANAPGFKEAVAKAITH